jgi:hypothetical protein
MYFRNICLPQPTKIGIYEFMHSRKYMFASTHENWYLQIYAFTKKHVCLNPRKLVKFVDINFRGLRQTCIFVNA